MASGSEADSRVRRDELEELHFIVHADNLGSILQHGVLSHRRAATVRHKSLAKPYVLDRRLGVRVSGGRLLHEYANLYICARNPTLYLMIRNAGGHESVLVLRISTDVLDLPGVVITDQNAASDWRRFAASPDGLSIVNKELVFAEYWTHPDQIEQWRHKSIKCAEVLVPDSVEPRFITGIYASCDERQQRVNATTNLPCTVRPHLFFI